MLQGTHAERIVQNVCFLEGSPIPPSMLVVFLLDVRAARGRRSHGSNDVEMER